MASAARSRSEAISRRRPPSPSLDGLDAAQMGDDAGEHSVCLRKRSAGPHQASGSSTLNWSVPSRRVATSCQRRTAASRSMPSPWTPASAVAADQAGCREHVEPVDEPGCEEAGREAGPALDEQPCDAVAGEPGQDGRERGVAIGGGDVDQRQAVGRRDQLAGLGQPAAAVHDDTHRRAVLEPGQPAGEQRIVGERRARAHHDGIVGGPEPVAEARARRRR